MDKMQTHYMRIEQTDYEYLYLPTIYFKLMTWLWIVFIQYYIYAEETLTSTHSRSVHCYIVLRYLFDQFD